jgi:chemotaxis protein MotB
MSARRHNHAEEHEEHENEERWLVSFADMMTLLFCLFMVLFAISSVNTSKFEALQQSLQDAFSGRVLTGGKAVMKTNTDTTTTKAIAPTLTPLQTLQQQDDSQDESAAKEEQDFQALKRRIDKLAKEAGLKGRVKTTVRRRGLIIQLLTDKVFFDSGQAVIKPGAMHVVDKIGDVVRDERRHPVVVEGHTDSQPIGGAQYPSNWELSGARAAAVVREFAADGVLTRRMSFSGYAAQEPVATNTTSAGRSRNRRVEIVLSRIHTSTPDTESDSAGRRNP